MKWKDSFHPYAATTIVFWSLAYVFTRLALRYFSPFSLGFLRYLTASVVLLILAFAWKVKPPEKKDLPWFIVAGASGFFLYMIAFNIGCVTVSSSTSSVIIALTPVITALLARFTIKETLRPLQWAAIGVSFAGVLVLTVLRGGLVVNGGIAWLVAAAALLSVYNLLQRRLTRVYSALQTSMFSIFMGTAMLTLFLPGAISDLKSAPAVSFLYILILGVFSSTVAFIAWSKAFAKAKNTSSVSNYMFVTPFLASLMGLLIAGEPVDAATVIGGAVIIGGLLLFHFGAARSVIPSETAPSKK
ncbi:EamA domain-containing membrane protein RarD [Papillibacter cinnamivorans DSM 12816]|uniref:EamA domain-containing membrane protein RarD n=2 Tax=Papillibacter TaxID=100175 RepID=A0A1W1YWK9_9FIRM|nr:EamA domain-containing membrane protein RarD [Papillibacter cinnamivorans DSM 12816]